MRVRHIMTSPVLTAPPTMKVLEAAKMMKDKGIERLPIVEEGRLVGIVTKDRVLRAAPSDATSLSLHEIHYLYGKLTLAEIMQRKVRTVTPDTTVESAVRIAQEARVGALPVIDNGQVVGILTTNDFFYLILNPLLGIGMGGSRIIVHQCKNAQLVSKAVSCVCENGNKLTNMAFLPSRRGEEYDLMIHIEEEDATTLIDCMKKAGLEAEERER